MDGKNRAVAISISLTGKTRSRPRLAWTTALSKRTTFYAGYVWTKNDNFGMALTTAPVLLTGGDWRSRRGQQHLPGGRPSRILIIHVAFGSFLKRALRRPFFFDLIKRRCERSSVLHDPPSRNGGVVTHHSDACASRSHSHSSFSNM
jgi:hypothetical protein